MERHNFHSATKRTITRDYAINNLTHNYASTPIIYRIKLAKSENAKQLTQNYQQYAIAFATKKTMQMGSDIFLWKKLILLFPNISNQINPLS